MTSTAWQQDRSFVIGLGISLILKLVLALAVRDHAAILDEGAYLELATALAAGAGYSGTFRPPGYPAFMAFWLAAGAGTLGVRLAQVALSGWSTVLMYRLGTRMGGARVGRGAALLFAFDPVLIAFTHRLWSETLFLTILLLVLDLLSRESEATSWRHWMLAGIALGAGALVRPMLVTFLPFLALWLFWALWRERQRTGRLLLWAPLVRFGVLVAACFLVILPWTLRNARETGTFILIDSNGPFNFLVGSQPEAAFVNKDDRWSDRYGVVDGQAYTQLVTVDAARAQALAMQQGWRNVAADPARFLGKSLWEAGHLWTMDSFLLRHLRNDWYGKGLPGWVIPVVTVVAAGYWVGLVLAGLTGLFLLLETSLARFGVLWALQATLLFGATYSLSRYGVPLRPFLALGAAGLLAGTATVAERWRGATGATRAAAVAALVLVSLSWVRDRGLMQDMLLQRGAGHRFTMEQQNPPAER